MHKGGVSIWFFIGISLVVNGALILGAGVYELLKPPAFQVVLFRLHASLWWGALLLIIGAIYVFKFRPRSERKKSPVAKSMARV